MTLAHRIVFGTTRIDVSHNGLAEVSASLQTMSRLVSAFDKPGVVTLGCNILDWIIGYVLIVSTPYFALGGSFALDVAPRKVKYKPPLDRLKY